MKMQLEWGQQRTEIEVPAGEVAVHRQAQVPTLANPAQAVAEALENPLGFPPLRLALTPDDHIAILVDEHLPRLTELLVPILQHLQKAHIDFANVTILCLPPAEKQDWVDDLPEEFQEVHIEVHQPDDRKKLSYLATTRQGRRIYLNRTAVDADQLILLTRRSYDCILGHAGGAGSLFPLLADEAMRKEARGSLSTLSACDPSWKLKGEAEEVAWLLGAPFLVQIIEGEGDHIAQVVCGPVESGREGEKIQDRFWQVTLDRRPEVVIASLTGDPARQTLEDLARAFMTASRVVKPGGRIAVLSASAPALGISGDFLRREEDPGAILRLLNQELPEDVETGFMWASAAQQAHLYLMSRLPEELVEEMQVTPLEKPEQTQRLLVGAQSWAYLPDAHKMMANINGPD